MDGWLLARQTDWVQQHPLCCYSIISRLSDHANMTPQIIHKTASLALRYRVPSSTPALYLISFSDITWHQRFFYSYCNYHFYQLDQTYKKSKYHLNIFCSFGTAYRVKITRSQAVATIADQTVSQ